MNIMGIKDKISIIGRIGIISSAYNTYSTYITYFPDFRLLRTIFVHAGAESSKKDYYLCKLELLQTNLWQRTIKTTISKSTN